MTPARLASIEAEMDSAGLREVYDALIQNGNSPNMAAMLATQKAPGSWNTDADFCRKEHDRMRSMSSSHVDEITKIARSSGINTTGKTYNGQLGKYNDPAAWVSCKDDVKQTAIRKGLDIDGVIKVNGYKGPEKKTRLASDIVDRIEREKRSQDRKLDEKCRTSDNARKELRRSIVSKHGSKK